MQFNYNNSYAVTASNSVIAPQSSYVVCVIALLTCCRAVEQIDSAYCSAVPPLYGICSTAKAVRIRQFSLLFGGYGLRFFYMVSALRLRRSNPRLWGGSVFWMI